jgi:hypothetical protein
VEIDGGGFEVGVPEQGLNGGKIGPAFYKVRGKAVASMPHAA